MREIKFRGIDLDGNFRYGFFKRVGAYSWIQNEQGGDEAVIENTVGQFTGLKDKNGKEIYEGDILQNSLSKENDDGFYKVIWMPGKARFIVERFWRTNRGFTSTDGLTESDSYFYKVIGNIHRNPELLK